MGQNYISRGHMVSIKCHKKFQDEGGALRPDARRAPFTSTGAGTCAAVRRGGESHSEQRRTLRPWLYQKKIKGRECEVNQEILKLPKRNDEVPDHDGGNRTGSGASAFCLPNHPQYCAQNVLSEPTPDLC